MPSVWMAPGGGREFNEGLFECVRREVFEETGLSIKNLRLKVCGNAYLKDLDQELFFHFVMADYAGGRVKASDEGKLVWLTQKQIAVLDNLLAEIHEILPLLFSDNNLIISYTAVYEKGNEMIEFHLENPT